MVHDLPPSRFTAVDIRDASIKRDVVSTKLSLPGLGAYLVCQVTDHPDQGVFEADLAVRGHQADLLPRTSYLLPANPTATDRVHGRDVCGTRPDLHHRPSIAIGHAVQRRVELVGRSAELRLLLPLISAPSAQGQQRPADTFLAAHKRPPHPSPHVPKGPAGNESDATPQAGRAARSSERGARRMGARSLPSESVLAWMARSTPVLQRATASVSAFMTVGRPRRRLWRLASFLMAPR